MEVQLQTAAPVSTRNEKSNFVFGLLLLAYFIQGVVIVWITPYGEFPDEQSHYEFSRFVRNNKRLPPISLDGKNLMGESFQPPLYYVSAAILLQPSLNKVTNIVILRFYSLLLGGVAVWLLWKTVRMVFPGNFAALTLSAGFAALNSQYIFIHSGISNIAMASFTGALTIYLVVRLLQSDNAGLIPLYLGLCFGASMISRTTCIYLLPVCLLALYWKANEHRDRIRTLLNWTIQFGLASAVIAGSWYLRNWIFYGDPVLWHFHQHVIGPDFARKEPLNLLYLLQAAAYLNASFWAYYGKHEFHAEIPEYAVYLLLETFALFGIKDLLRSPTSESRRKSFLLLICAAVLAVSTVLLIQTSVASPQGRYFFMAITPLAIMLGAGIAAIIPERYRTVTSCALLLFLFSFSLYLLSSYWYPHYRGKTVSDSIWVLIPN